MNPFIAYFIKFTYLNYFTHIVTHAGPQSPPGA